MLYDDALGSQTLQWRVQVHHHYSVHVHGADDELDRMRQQMAETASLLASAAYEQPQVQLHHYQAKLTEHLANPTQPLNLTVEGLEGQPVEGQARKEEPSGERAGVVSSGLTESPPRTPGQDAAGRAARAKRVASSREVCSSDQCCVATLMPCFLIVDCDNEQLMEQILDITITMIVIVMRLPHYQSLLSDPRAC